MREMRQLPRFKKFIKEIGLFDYWNKFGWPDICRRLDNGIGIGDSNLKRCLTNFTGMNHLSASKELD